MPPAPFGGEFGLSAQLSNPPPSLSHGGLLPPPVPSPQRNFKNFGAKIAAFRLSSASSKSPLLSRRTFPEFIFQPEFSLDDVEDVGDEIDGSFNLPSQISGFRRNGSSFFLVSVAKPLFTPRRYSFPHPIDPSVRFSLIIRCFAR